MRVTAPQGAPNWAHDLAREIQQVLDNMIWPYVRRSPVLVVELPDASTNAWKKFYVSNGVSGMTEVTSNGTDWKYPDGTTA